MNGSEMEVKVILRDFRPEVALDGPELLKLESGQPGARVTCTAGALWLTQPGDPHDHIIQAGQSFRLDRRGTVLVQGLPRGKALILPPAAEATAGAKQPQSPKIRAHPMKAE